jgi:hypothetical protein
MTKDEALKKAFKQAFQLGQDYWYQADHEYVSQNKKSDVTRAKFEQLMEDAIKEALAQPEQEQEPVAWLNEEKKIIYWHNTHETDDYHGFKRTTPLYTSPPQRKPLSEEEIGAILEGVNAYGTRLYTFARAIEAAHGIKGKA